MKIFMLLIASTLFLSACATTQDNTATPGLHHYQTRTLPTGGSDAAQAAATL